MFDCKQHPGSSASARCVECGSLLCGDCRAKLGGRNYCRPCVPQELVRKLPGRRSPAAAAILSVVPGLGQMFAGEKLRGLVFGGSAIALGNLDPLPPATILFFLWAFNLFDAHSIAVARNAKAAGRALDAGEKRQKFLVSLFAIGTAGVVLARETIAPNLDVAVLWPAALGLFALSAVAEHLDRKRSALGTPSPAKEAAHVA